MNTLKLLLAAGALAISSSAASAAVIYADNVVATTPGAGFGTPGRSDPNAALNGPDGVFYSPGLGGDITLSFGQTFNAGGNITTYEITFGNIDNHVETADIFAVILGVGETFVGSINNTDAQSGATLTYAGMFDAIRLLDTSPLGGGSVDGFDVDAIGVNPIPLPAAGLLLLGGLAGLGALKRKKA